METLLGQIGEPIEPWSELIPYVTSIEIVIAYGITIGLIK